MIAQTDAAAAAGLAENAHRQLLSVQKKGMGSDLCGKMTLSLRSSFAHQIIKIQKTKE